MIANIQALRAFASIAVMFYHMNYRWMKDLHTDFQGVAVFFVISGFIMAYITLKDNKRPSPAPLSSIAQ
jgi:exopolysaccharide production protein ExoZ